MKNYMRRYRICNAIGKLFGCGIRCVYSVKDNTPIENSIVVARIGVNRWGRCVYREGEYRSVLDGKLLENVTAFMY